MQSFNSILYVSDGSDTQERALTRAVSLAENNQARLTVMEAVPDVTPGFRTWTGGPEANEVRSKVLQDRQDSVSSLVEPFKDRLDIRIAVLEGKTSLEAVRAVLNDHHDLLMKPAENPGYTQRLFGSDDMQLLRNCPCPVWLTHREEKLKYRSILAAVDFDLDRRSGSGDSLNEHIAEIACSVALSDFAALHFVHVWDAPGEVMLRVWTTDPDRSAAAYVEGVRSSHQTAFDGFRDQLRNRLGAEAYEHIGPRFHLHRGDPAKAIAATAKELHADLLVMGTVARTGVAGWLIGNTSEAVLEQVQCAVLAVKPRGFVSPFEAPND